MKTDMKRILAQTLLVAALGANVAQAKECKGVNFPDQAQVGGSNLTLNGLGLRQATAFKVNVYVAALYVTKTSTDANALLGANTPSELILQFVRNVGADDLRKGWSEGFEKNSKDQLPALNERIAMLNGWMADVKTGERLTFIRKAGAGLQVDVNGAVKGLAQFPHPVLPRLQSRPSPQDAYARELRPRQTRRGAWSLPHA